jgi:hypothetical protein
MSSLSKTAFPQPRHLLKIVTLEPLSVWGCGINHWKPGRVYHQLGVKKFQSSACASNLMFFPQLLFCPEQILAALAVPGAAIPKLLVG